MNAVTVFTSKDTSQKVETSLLHSASRLTTPMMIVEDTGSLVVQWSNTAMEDVFRQCLTPGTALDRLVDVSTLTFPTDKSVMSAFSILTPGPKTSIHGYIVPGVVGTWTIFFAENTNLTSARLEASEERFQALVERAPVPTMLSEAGLRLGHVNDAFIKLMGVPSSELLGTGWLSFVHPEDMTDLIANASSAIFGESVEFEVRLFSATQGQRSVIVRLAPVQFPGEGAGFVGTMEDQTARLIFEAELDRAAHYDSLTQLPNRISFHQMMEEYLVDQKLGSLFYVDVDDFKLVNDSFGHTSGDLFLQIITQRLQSVVGDLGSVFRLAGDEFSVIVKNADKASQLAEAIGVTVREPVVLNEVRVFPSVSIGIANFIEGQTSSALIADADAAMYAAKKAGKGGFAVCDEALRESRGKTLQELSALRGAMSESFPEKDGTIEMFYQPITNSTTGRVISLEALLRWNHPVWGPMRADRVAELAENYNVMTLLGAHVFKKACEGFKVIKDTLREKAPDRVNINVSTKQLYDLNFSQTVEDIIRNAGLTFSDVAIEVTESVFLDPTSSAVDVLRTLKEKGLRIKVDDFGTGYSSLSYLENLPVDCLKVDKAFVKAIDNDTEQKYRVLKAIKLLADLFDLETVAEGVETIQQKEVLNSLGYTRIQGWLYAPALSLTDTVSYIKENSNV